VKNKTFISKFFSNMRNKKILLCIAALCFLLPLSGGAQDARKALEQLAKKYDGQKNYHYRLRYDFFADGQTAPAETMDGVASAWKGKVYHKTGKMETLRAEGLIAVIDHENKYVILDKSDRYAQHEANSVQAILDKLETTGQKLTLESLPEGKNRLNVYAEGAVKPAYALLYKTGYIIEKITMYLDGEEAAELAGEAIKAGRFELVLEERSPGPLPLELASVVTKKSGAYKVTPAYQHYLFHNLSNQE
jgi:hypothetical protein